jgi:hypothetical protein
MILSMITLHQGINAAAFLGVMRLKTLPPEHHANLTASAGVTMLLLALRRTLYFLDTADATTMNVSLSTRCSL